MCKIYSKLRKKKPALRHSLPKEKGIYSTVCNRKLASTEQSATGNWHLLNSLQQETGIYRTVCNMKLASTEQSATGNWHLQKTVCNRKMAFTEQSAKETAIESSLQPETGNTKLPSKAVCNRKLPSKAVYNRKLPSKAQSATRYLHLRHCLR